MISFMISSQTKWMSFVYLIQCFFILKCHQHWIFFCVSLSLFFVSLVLSFVLFLYYPTGRAGRIIVWLIFVIVFFFFFFFFCHTSYISYTFVFLSLLLRLLFCYCHLHRYCFFLFSLKQRQNKVKISSRQAMYSKSTILG